MITADIWSSLCLCRPVLQTPPPINCPILSKTLLQIYFISSPGRGEVGDCKEQKETCTNRSMPESTQTEGKDSHARRRCRVGSVLWNRLTERTPWLCPRPRTPKDCLTVEKNQTARRFWTGDCTSPFGDGVQATGESWRTWSVGTALVLSSRATAVCLRASVRSD